MELKTRLRGELGEFECRVRVVDDRGSPAAGIAVRLTVGGEGFSGRAESAARTDLRGIAVLSGVRVGEKTLWIDPSPSEVHRRCALQKHVFEMPRGVSDREVELAQGRSISGIVTWLSEPTLEPLLIRASHPDSGFRTARVLGGAFRIDGLRASDYELTTVRPASPIHPVVVTAGQTDVKLELKHEHDPRPVGLHRAEIHGAVLGPGGAPVHVDAVHAVAVGIARARARLVAVGPGEWDATTRPIGAFHLVGLEAGEYTIEAFSGRKVVARFGPFELGRDTVLNDVSIELP